MTYKENYELALKKAKRKKECNLSLKKAEKIALSGRWFFTIPMPVTAIEKIVDMANQYNVRPSELAMMWIERGMAKNES